MDEQEQSPQDGDQDSFACDGCGHGIITIYKAAEKLWVGDYVVLGNELIYHPDCVQELVDEALNRGVNNTPELEHYTNVELADDLATFDADFEGTTQTTLLPFIELWRKERS